MADELSEKCCSRDNRIEKLESNLGLNIVNGLLWFIAQYKTPRKLGRLLGFY